MHSTRGPVWACLREFALIAMWAVLATIASRASDSVSFLNGSLSTCSGTYGKLRPFSFTILSTAMFAFAGLLLNVAILVLALRTTVLGRNGDDEFACPLPRRSIVATVLALLIAITPACPISFTVHRARVFVAVPDFHVTVLVAKQECRGVTTALWFCRFEISLLSASAAGGAALAPLTPTTRGIGWATGIATQLFLSVTVLKRALGASELSLHRDAENPGLIATATKVLSWVRPLRIACVPVAPTALARNWASWLLAELLEGLVWWRIVLTLSTTTHRSIELQPLAVPVDWSDTI